MPQQAFVSLPDLPPEETPPEKPPQTEVRYAGSSGVVIVNSLEKTTSSIVLRGKNNGSENYSNLPTIVHVHERDNEILKGTWQPHHLHKIAMAVKWIIPFAFNIRVDIRKDERYQQRNAAGHTITTYYCTPKVYYNFPKGTKTWAELDALESELVRQVRPDVPEVVTTNDMIVLPEPV